jgi:hypothetical protein
MAKRIQILVDDSKHEELAEAKNGRSWLEMLEDGAERND